MFVSVFFQRIACRKEISNDELNVFLKQIERFFSALMGTSKLTAP